MEKILKVVRVVDTRTFEEGPDGKWCPIPGSGSLHECARCGRLHEIHAQVELAGGGSAVVGTTCADRKSLEFKKLRSAARKATKIARLQAEILKEGDDMDGYDRHAVLHKTGIADWLALEEWERASFIYWLRDAPRYSGDCDLVAASALEDLEELRDILKPLLEYRRAGRPLWKASLGGEEGRRRICEMFFGPEDDEPT